MLVKYKEDAHGHARVKASKSESLENKALFMHCNYGLASVSMSDYKTKVKHLLEAHGIDNIQIAD